MSKRKYLTNEYGEVLDPRTTPEYYTPAALRAADVWTPENLQAEYSRLRSIARKRLERLGKSEFKESQVYKLNVGQYAPVKELTPEQILQKLAEVSRFIMAKTGSVSGLREQRSQALESLHERGLSFVNRANFKKFGEFMEDWRMQQARDGAVGSDEVASLFNAAEKKKIDPEKLSDDFEFWLEHQEELEKMPELKTKSGKPASAAAYRKKLTRGKR